MLKKNPEAGVKVFVIWEPVLQTDWNRPGDSITANIPDGRASHYWDPNRRLSTLYGGPAKIASIAATETVKFRMSGVVWDSAVVYPPGIQWGHSGKLLVAPVFKFSETLLQ